MQIIKKQLAQWIEMKKFAPKNAASSSFCNEMWDFSKSFLILKKNLTISSDDPFGL